MPNKEPGAIRQLFAFVGESNSKMRISIFYRLLLLFIFAVQYINKVKPFLFTY